MSRFFERLSMSTGEVAFEPEGRANALNLEPASRIVHRDHPLTVIAGRLLPLSPASGMGPP